ncbi:MAG TPA: DegT/DnrJ/EryC1/StrS family aminotransferase [Candidatus Acidoferrum sp.]|nr:DegT/DnrJ/EryC1/StrS family aminotransferase [Candidatus Acidoferrum sp.]
MKISDIYAMHTSAKTAVPSLDLKAEYASIAAEVRAAIEGVLASQRFILGAEGEALEQEIAAYCDAKFAVGLANGTDALTLALVASGVGPGDEVIVPAFTFVATATAVIRAGAKPIFADVRADTLNLDPEQIEARRTPRTKAVMPVHLFGAPADVDPIGEISSRYGIVVIEDNAQAIGARYRGQRTGSLGTAAGISFYPTKNLGAYGDAGMLVTNSEEIAARVRRLRNHGQTDRYTSSEPGWNSRLDEIQAAILRVKLSHLDEWTERRQAHAKRYNQLLAGLPDLILPHVSTLSESVYHAYTIRIKSAAGTSARREKIRQLLENRGIGTSVFYPIPLPFQPLFSGTEFQASGFPNAKLAATQVLSLPLFTEISAAQMERVVEELAAALKETA